jgi:hypothetical protein
MRRNTKTDKTTTSKRAEKARRASKLRNNHEMTEEEIAEPSDRPVEKFDRNHDRETRNHDRETRRDRGDDPISKLQLP